MTAYLDGPENSVYEDGRFQLNITLTSEYPFKPPEITTEQQIFHPNFTENIICVDILTSKWSPALKI
jgi:ubiquitin-protein ligase